MLLIRNCFITINCAFKKVASLWLRLVGNVTLKNNIGICRWGKYRVILSHWSWPVLLFLLSPFLYLFSTFKAFLVPYFNNSAFVGLTHQHFSTLILLCFIIHFFNLLYSCLSVFSHLKVFCILVTDNQMCSKLGPLAGLTKVEEMLQAVFFQQSWESGCDWEWRVIYFITTWEIAFVSFHRVSGLLQQNIILFCFLKH